MNDNNVTDSVQESSLKETQSSQNTSSGIGQKGNTLIIVALVFLMAIVGAGAYYLKTTKSAKPPQAPQLPQPTQISQLTPTVSSQGQIANWKTYNSNNMKFSLQYPERWIVKENGKDCPSFSDISDPQMKSPTILKNGHAWITVCIRSDDMPSTLPYAIKDTIKPFSINNYSGLRGKEIFVLPGGIEGEDVYLQNPNGGYVSLELHVGDTQIFNKIISTFNFIDKNQGKIKIMQGSVYFVSKGGKQQLLANKEDFVKDEVGPLNFTDAVLSPDQSKVLFLAQGGITSELLFYTTVNNIRIKKIHTAAEAVWSNNSRYIAYSSKVADAGGPLFIGVYDTMLDKNLNLTKAPTIPNITNPALEYSDIRWEADSGIKVHYLARSDAPHGENLGEGELVIPLTSFALQ